MITRVVVTRYGGREFLDVVLEPLRAPANREVRVKVLTAGVALADVMRREGLYPGSPTPPFTPGYDAIGMVDDIGSEVHEFAQGETVAVFFSGTGGYATHVYAKPEELVSIPAQPDPARAVAIILNYVSAYQMLHRIAKVSEGDRVLIHGASGGVGTALLDLGRLSKLRMFGTASQRKHATVSQFGAQPIDYQNEDFVHVLRNQAPQGMDAVFDPIGRQNWQRSFQTLNKHGRFVGYGYTSILEQGNFNDWETDWKGLATQNATKDGNPIHMYSVTALKNDRVKWFREDVRFLFSLLKEGKIDPLISHKIPLQDVANAHALLESSSAVGKVVLIC